MHNHTDTHIIFTFTHIIPSEHAFSQAHNIAFVPQGHKMQLCHFVSLIRFFRSAVLNERWVCAIHGASKGVTAAVGIAD